MNKEIYKMHLKLFEKYIDQQSKLPQIIREQVSKRCSNEKIQLYGYFDLSQKLKSTQGWLVLTNEHIFIFEDGNENVFKISELSSIKEVHSLSCTTLFFMKASDMPPLGSIRFGHRQKVMFEQIKHVIECKIKDKDYHFVDIDADKKYIESTLKNIAEAQNSFSGEKTNTLLRLLKYLTPYKKELTLGTVGAIGATLISLVPAYVSGQLIDEVVKAYQAGTISQTTAQDMGAKFLVILCTSYVLREFFRWLRLKKMSIMGEKVAMELRKELYEHLQTLGLDFFAKKHTGSLISRVSSDTDRIWDFVAFGIVEVSISIITLISLSAVLISLDFNIGLLMSLPVPLLLLSIYKHGERMKKLFIKAWRKWSDVTAVLSDTIPGIQVVKAFNQEKKEIKRFNKRNVTVTNEFFNIHEAWTKFWPVLMLSIHAIIIGVWFSAMPRLISLNGEEGHLTAGTFVSILLYMGMFVAPIEIVGQVSRMLNRALSSAYRIFEVLDSKPSLVEAEDAITHSNIKGEIEFRNVYFSYDKIRHVVKNMNFKIRPGEMIGLVGSSGGGKSTITKLINRFYDITEGEILIDGKKLRDLEIGTYRKQVGMVLQEPYLFHGTISENIAYGIESVSKKEVIEAAKTANAHDFITKLPHGYDTIVGERGQNLSGGERQRISIARAVLSNPKILILDEATSAVDTETERKIQDALDKLVEGRTVIAIAHRLSTLRAADRIFVISNGEIVEEGTHDHLLNKKGEYEKLYNMQLDRKGERI